MCFPHINIIVTIHELAVYQTASVLHNTRLLWLEAFYSNVVCASQRSHIFQQQVARYCFSPRSSAFYRLPWLSFLQIHQHQLCYERTMYIYIYKTRKEEKSKFDYEEILKLIRLKCIATSPFSSDFCFFSLDKELLKLTK